LNLNSSEKVNETIFLSYTKKYTITPLIYKILIGMCSPDLLKGISINFPNQKAIIFDRTNLLELETFENDYLRPFFEKNILILFDNDDNEMLYNEYKEKILTNIFIIQFFSLPELMLKLQALPYLIKTLKEVSLVIADSINALLSQSVKYINDEFENEENVQEHRKITFDKKKRKSLDETEVKLYTDIDNMFSNYKKEFNFNLIFTIFNFSRLNTLNYLAFKKSDPNFVCDNQRYFDVKVGDEKKTEFIFGLKDIDNNNQIMCLEPINHFINCNCTLFACVKIKENNTQLEFKAFIKTPNNDQVTTIHEENFNINIKDNE
jgi:hypothetical protein